jgi:exopolysaccharide biosynthesis polyprenyl glycosylphosphotransferase
MGSHLETVVVIGGRNSAVALAARLQARSRAGYRVAGLCIPTIPGVVGATHPPITDFPVLGALDDAVAAVRRTGASLVVIAGSEQIGPEEVRHLAWALEGTGVRLALAPSLAGVAGPRIRIRQIADMPLMQISEPTFTGPKLIAKTTLDFTVALTALLVLSPVLLTVGLAIKLSDGGPVFFRHQRVGLGGRRFHVLKFRSMTPNADKKIQWAKHSTEQNDSVFFKAADDPRITPVGRLIRRTSIDEIPQLLNVLAGQMSMVGPRPLVPGEGSTIRSFVERRMLVKPGITGLWQVSGRSALSEDERIRLDFYYVENWSLSNDLVLMAKTIGTVLSGKGAY